MFTAEWHKDETCFFTCVTDKDRPTKHSDLRVVLLIFAQVHLKQQALTKLLLLHAHYVRCSHFVLCVPILFVKFAAAEFAFVFFPLQLENSLSFDVVLSGNVVLVNKSVLFFSQRQIAHIVFILRPA